MKTSLLRPGAFDASGKKAEGKPDVADFEAEVESVREHKKRAVAKFRHLNDMTEAETARGFEIWVSEDQIPPLQEGQYYTEDIVGLRVVSDKGQDYGLVREVIL